MDKYIDCSKVYVKKGKYGFGVYAREDITEGTIVERCIMYRLVNVDGNENRHLFTWSDDRTVWSAASGCVPFYNHSTNPNVKKNGNLIDDTMTIVAIKNIKKDEELVNTYYSSKWRKCFKNLEN